MTFKTFADIPVETLEALIALLQKKYRMPTAASDVASMNFVAGQCSVIQELIDQRNSRLAKAEAEKDGKRG